MAQQWRILWVLSMVFLGASGHVGAEWLAGRVDQIDIRTGEIEIDGVRYRLGKGSRERSSGSAPMLSRYKAGDGVLYKPGPNGQLLAIDKPAGGIDLPAGSGSGR